MIEAICDSCGKRQALVKRPGDVRVWTEGGWAAMRSHHDDETPIVEALVCPECFERHWASITKHRRMQEAT